ncbi:MAG TPA: sulfatase, partial [Caulifigura sp.]|nr:sulfatase [Caulifigura sp.]
MQLRLVTLCCAMALTACSTSSAADRPNILWITAEDHGPQLGCYGDAYAVTPNLDAFAQRACRYTFCWSNCPVCAPARTTLITGMYAQSLGAEHMRSMVPVPNGFQLLPQHLRRAGYYCSNNVKEDYNLAPEGQVWDESSNRAHWRKRGKGQPFFAVFNHTITHESQIRNKIDAADRVHDPAGARVPAYHPDTPEVRKDWAQYYDRLTMMDTQVGQLFRDLEADGLADDTIVFFFSDHGSGMPRSKRWLYDSGLHVPLLVHIPKRWRYLAAVDFEPAGVSSRLVSFVDFAPTIL